MAILTPPDVVSIVIVDPHGDSVGDQYSNRKTR